MKRGSRSSRWAAARGKGDKRMLRKCVLGFSKQSVARGTRTYRYYFLLRRKVHSARFMPPLYKETGIYEKGAQGLSEKFGAYAVPTWYTFQGEKISFTRNSTPT